jgi:hypothetical protein
MTQSRASLIVAIVLLLLPVLYVGSYLALVVPLMSESGGAYEFSYPLVEGSDAHIWLSKFYYPLERIDMAVRPDSWRWTQTH